MKNILTAPWMVEMIRTVTNMYAPTAGTSATAEM